MLRDYLDRFDPGFVGLTGDLRRHRSAVGDALGSTSSRAELPTGGYEVNHSTAVIGVDADDRAPGAVWTRAPVRRSSPPTSLRRPSAEAPMTTATAPP